MQPKHPLIQKSLSQLASLPHLKVETQVEAMPYVGETAIADGQMAVHSLQGDATYVFEVKTNVTSETVEETIAYLKKLQQRLPAHYRLLLITDKLSKSATKKLIEQNLEFIDVSGNCYLNSPALYLITSNTPLTETPSKNLDITPNALQLMYVLRQKRLTELPKSLFPQLAEAAGISLKSVQNQLDRLHQLQYLQRQPGGGYRITDYMKLLERWEFGYTENLRPKLLLGTYTSTSGQQFVNVQDNIINLAKSEGYLIGGELGGAIATRYLSPIGATLHLPETQNPAALSLKLKLKPDPHGSIIFLRQFGSCNAWENSSEPMLVDPLLIHAEMMTLASDERVKETSDRLFRQYLVEQERVVEAI
jgi:hypothetical protein